ncbi:hypothetical protein GCM10022252_03110 [Streptosporangium oxazolinicum]|uniref:Secreted protein n=1 Tax=Streptosporangium oxazolinicum TaxID=909287 RepID=A0ABP8AA43_9ACTN
MAGLLPAWAGPIASTRLAPASTLAMANRWKERDIMNHDTKGTTCARNDREVTIHPMGTWRLLPVPGELWEYVPA